MKLKAYLEGNKLSPADFARLVGASEFGVRKWISGERRPRANAIRRISEATHGSVGPSDFFDIGSTEDATSKFSTGVAP